MTENQDKAQNGHDSTHDLNPVDHTVILDAPRELGSYRLTRLLGRGGMGEVWQAFDKNLERDVALKLMRKELLQNEDATRRFAREARAVARLNHPNIVQVYTFGDEQGLMYFVMELVHGETVSQRLKREGCIPLSDALRITLQAIEGLGYAAERGIIHRDIKPSNLMVTPEQRVKIADFGLAKMVEHDTQMTAAGTAMGSPNYMSPEQARGEEADHRSDIYALGVSLFQMLCGGLPFTSNSPVSVLLKHIQDPLPEPDHLRQLQGGTVLQVIKKMTAKKPGDRYQTYSDLANALMGLVPDLKVPGAHAITASMPAADGTVSPPPPHSGAFAPSGSQSQPDTPVPPAEFAGKTIPPKPVQQDTASDPAISNKESKPFSTRYIGLIAAALCALLIAAGVLWYLNSRQIESMTDAAVANINSDTSDSPLALPNQANQGISIPAAGSIAQTPLPPSPPPPTPAGSQTPLPIQGPQVPGSTVSVPPSPTMSPVTVSAMVMGEATPFPGQELQVTPRPSLQSLLPSGVPLPGGHFTRGGSGGSTYILGTSTGAADEMIPIYRDSAGRSLIRQYPRGTEVGLISDGPAMLRIMTPDGQAGYVYKRMALKK